MVGAGQWSGLDRAGQTTDLDCSAVPEDLKLGSGQQESPLNWIVQGWTLFELAKAGPEDWALWTGLDTRH